MHVEHGHGIILSRKEGKKEGVPVPNQWVRETPSFVGARIIKNSRCWVHFTAECVNM